MTNRQHVEYVDRKKLQKNGWDVDKTDSIKFNSGSETLRHLICKTVAAYELHQRGYRVSTEVEMGDGEVDVLAYGADDKLPIVIECETDPAEDVVQDKLERYVNNQPVRDMFLLNVDEMPDDYYQALSWVGEEL